MNELIKDLCFASFVSGCEVSENDNVLLEYQKVTIFPIRLILTMYKLNSRGKANAVAT